uniref:Exocyst complex component 4 n=1 Tax=Anthurium amnicola TaxID=1678845 RepID=A0A1D1Y8M6_9ARAE
MEAKKPSVSTPPPPSSSLAADLFGKKNPPAPSSSSFFHSVFPPASTVMSKNSSRSDVYGSSWKKEAQSQSWDAQNVSADGIPQGGGNREMNSAYEHEKIDPCTFSSSLYYGGQDICTNIPSSHNPGYNVSANL